MKKLLPIACGLLASVAFGRGAPASNPVQEDVIQKHVPTHNLPTPPRVPEASQPLSPTPFVTPAPPPVPEVPQPEPLKPKPFVIRDPLFPPPVPEASQQPPPLLVIKLAIPINETIKPSPSPVVSQFQLTLYDSTGDRVHEPDVSQFLPHGPIENQSTRGPSPPSATQFPSALSGALYTYWVQAFIDLETDLNQRVQEPDIVPKESVELIE